MPQSLWDLLNGGGLTPLGGAPVTPAYKTATFGNPYNHNSQQFKQPFAPTTSGQAAAPQAPAAPSAPQNNDSGNYLSILQAQYNAARQNIDSLNPTLDTSYNTAKGDIESAKNAANTTATTQKGNLENQFGGLLKSQIQTYRDLGQQRQGIFSGLNALDSSAYENQQFRADQQLSDQQNNTQLQKTNSLKSVDDQLNAYTQQADSALQNLGSQYQQGKQQLAYSLAQNDIGNAQAVQSYLDQLQQRAAAVQQNMQQWAQQSAILKSQGIDVGNSISGINGDQYASNVSNQLAQARSFGDSLIPQLTSPYTGQGYMGRSGKKYKDANQAMAAGDA